jgi:hypothetical protein
MGSALRGLGILLFGAALGAAVSQVTGSNLGLLILLAVAGIALAFAGGIVDRLKAKAEQVDRTAAIARVEDALMRGQAILTELQIWSRDHPYSAPSLNDDPFVVGSLGVAKTDFLIRVETWKTSTAEFVEEEFGDEVISFRGAKEEPPYSYVHDHLWFAWAEVRGRMAWLQERITRPMPASRVERRSPRSSRRDR